MTIDYLTLNAAIVAMGEIGRGHARPFVLKARFYPLQGECCNGDGRPEAGHGVQVFYEDPASVTGWCVVGYGDPPEYTRDRAEDTKVEIAAEYTGKMMYADLGNGKELYIEVKHCCGALRMRRRPSP